MTETVAPAITALFGSVIRPVSDASADCAWSIPRSSKASITPRTNLRMETLVHFPSRSSAHPEIIPQNENRKLPQLGLAEKANRSDSPNALIRQIGQICTSVSHIFQKIQKPFCLEKYLQSDVCFVAPLGGSSVDVQERASIRSSTLSVQQAYHRKMSSPLNGRALAFPVIWGTRQQDSIATQPVEV